MSVNDWFRERGGTEEEIGVAISKFYFMDGAETYALQPDPQPEVDRQPIVIVRTPVGGTDPPDKERVRTILEMFSNGRIKRVRLRTVMPGPGQTIALGGNQGRGLQTEAPDDYYATYGAILFPPAMRWGGSPAPPAHT